MERGRFSKFVWIAAVGALGIFLCGCTAGGQFDPTEIVSNDMFSTKKKIQGDREPLFPNGVPGAETGVPPDLMKGYQAPPEQAAAVETPNAAAKPVPAAEKPKPKPKPKPAVARASPPAAPTSAPQSANTAWPAPQQPAAPQTNWPSPSGGQSSPPAQTNWPAPPASAQTNWPAPPPAGQAQQGAQTNWPPPPAPATSSH